MKKKWRFALVLFVTGVLIICCAIVLCLHIKIKKSQRAILDEAEKIISSNISNENNELTKISEAKDTTVLEQDLYSTKELQEDNNIIGKLIIPKLNVEAPIKEGTTQNVLKEAIGHFSRSMYWNGNVCLASHNRGIHAHFFEKINTLKQNDEIIYKTKLGTKVYKVMSVLNIDEKNTEVLKNTKENCLTLITCVKKNPALRLCVKAVEKIE